AAYYESAGRVDLTERHQGEKPVSISGKDIRATLLKGEQVDPRVMRPSTSEILGAAMKGKA
ncbi:MAG TPA: sulfate adenylyltransferase, partial [Planctomycetaceae bacterium]|nr:sulfate adenylyltransferase [Planctomycetaceae bacterium]